MLWINKIIKMTGKRRGAFGGKKEKGKQEKRVKQSDVKFSVKGFYGHALPNYQSSSEESDENFDVEITQLIDIAPDDSLVIEVCEQNTFEGNVECNNGKNEGDSSVVVVEVPC